MPSTYLSRTIGTTGNRKTFTYSAWIKRSIISNEYPRIASSYWGSGDRIELTFTNTDEFQIYHLDNSSNNINLTTNKKFRDTSAWYHIVIAVDTTQATASNRVKLYVNGVQETSFSTATYPSQNDNTIVNYSDGSNSTFRIGGSQHYNPNGLFGGSMSHINFIDGTAYDATAFGQYDANGVWTIKTSPSVTYGTNGFFILEDGNSVTDQSGNGNNWTVGGGTLTNTEDNPSNVFATMNPLSSQATLSNGNTKSQYGGGGIQRNSSPTTLGMLSGKYYCECKITLAGSTSFPGLGIAATNSLLSNKFGNYYLGEHSDTYGYYTGNGYIYNNTSEVASGLSIFATNDIAGLALDLDSAQNTLKFYKNGSLVYTLNITNNSNGWFFADTHESGELGARAEWNFGNGYFGTTAVASAGTNASGIGIFEYDVPTGYTALSTKGLDL